MLEYLKNQHSQPSDIEQFVLHVIRVMLEEGWAITVTDFYILMEAIDIDLQVRGKIKGLIKILRNSLGIDEEAYFRWLKDRGAVFPVVKKPMMELLAPKIGSFIRLI